MVGNQVRELERRLNGRLLNRTTRRQSLTELGKRYYTQCVEIIAPVDAAELDAREMHTSPHGRLRASCPVIYGTRVLAPILANCLDRYPEVHIELSLNDRYVDLAEDGFDAAVRVGVLPNSGLIAKRPAPAHLSPQKLTSFVSETDHGRLPNCPLLPTSCPIPATGLTSIIADRTGKGYPWIRPTEVGHQRSLSGQNTTVAASIESPESCRSTQRQPAASCV